VHMVSFVLWRLLLKAPLLNYWGMNLICNNSVNVIKFMFVYRYINISFSVVCMGDYILYL
jgi:hypothetical protein